MEEQIVALIKCPECSKEISDVAKTCIHCGYPLGKLFHQQHPHTLSKSLLKTEKATTIAIIIFSIFPLLGVIALIQWLTLKAKRKTVAEINRIILKTQISVLVIIFILAVVVSAIVVSNNLCKRCNKTGIYEIGSNKYCETHYMEMIGHKPCKQCNEEALYEIDNDWYCGKHYFEALGEHLLQ